MKTGLKVVYELNPEMHVRFHLRAIQQWMRSILDVKHITRLIDHDLDQIGHDLDNLDPNLPLGDFVQDLYSTDPTHEHMRDDAACKGLTPQHELDHTDQE